MNSNSNPLPLIVKEAEEVVKSQWYAETYRRKVLDDYADPVVREEILAMELPPGAEETIWRNVCLGTGLDPNTPMPEDLWEEWPDDLFAEIE